MSATAEKQMHFRAHLPNLLREMIEGHPSPGPLITATNLTQECLCRLAERAAEIDDPQLNICMLELALYEVHPMEITGEINAQKKRIKKEVK